MNEELINAYVEEFDRRVHDLTKENILLKAQLSVALKKIKEIEQNGSTSDEN